MRIQPKINDIKKICLILGIVLAILIGLIVYIFPMNGSLFGWRLHNETSSGTKRINEVNYDKPSSNEINAGQTIKDRTIKNDKQTDDRAPNQTSDKIGLTISASGVSGETAQIRVLIDSLVADSECSITLKQGPQTRTYTAPIQLFANSSTCRGFDIPVNSLTPGNWSFTISVMKNGTTTGSIAGELSI